MKKVLMLATTAAMIDQFNKANIELLNKMGYQVDMIGNFEAGNPVSEGELNDFRKWMDERRGNCYIYPATRHPLDFRNNIAAYNKAVKIVRQNHYSFIHCHNPLGAVIGRFAAHTTHTKLIYTAHGFHFFDGAPLKNWLFFYPVEKFLSRWTDALVLINKEDYERAKRKFHAKKIYYIPGIGIDVHKFENIDTDRRKFWRSNGIEGDAFIVTMVGELIPRKNHEAGIKALGYLKKQGKIRNIQLVICGCGSLEEDLKKMILKFGVKDYVHLLGFRQDIPVILHCSDAFLFMSHQEGLSVAMMEAMASGLPVICSKIRGNTDLVDDGVNGIFAENDSKKIASKLLFLQSHEDIRNDIANAAKEKAKKYSIDNVEISMRKIYGVLSDE